MSSVNLNANTPVKFEPKQAKVSPAAEKPVDIKQASAAEDVQQIKAASKEINNIIEIAKTKSNDKLIETAKNFNSAKAVGALCDGATGAIDLVTTVLSQIEETLNKVESKLLPKEAYNVIKSLKGKIAESKLGKLAPGLLESLKSLFNSIKKWAGDHEKEIAIASTVIIIAFIISAMATENSALDITAMISTSIGIFATVKKNINTPKSDNTNAIEETDKNKADTNANTLNTVKNLTENSIADIEDGILKLEEIIENKKNTPDLSDDLRDKLKKELAKGKSQIQALKCTKLKPVSDSIPIPAIA